MSPVHADKDGLSLCRKGTVYSRRTTEREKVTCRACLVELRQPVRVSTLANEPQVGERITHAAIRMSESEVWALPAPARHHHLIHAWSEAHRDRDVGGRGAVPRCKPLSQGFLTSRGRYVDRVEAKLIAEAAGQLLNIPGRSSQLEELYSEDVW